MLWSFRDFTPEELEARGHPDGVAARNDYWRWQHESALTSIEVFNNLSRAAWEHSDRSEPFEPLPLAAGGQTSAKKSRSMNTSST